MTIFWIVGTILALMLTLHILRRFAAPFRIRVYLKSGSTIKINVEDFTSTSTTLKWTHADFVSEVMSIPLFEEIAAVKVVDRRKQL